MKTKKLDTSVNEWKEHFDQAILTKSFCVVGNAQSLLGKNLGSFIDGHDYIIRMNHGFPRHKQHQGEKTSLVATSCNIDKADYKKYYGKAKPMWVTTKREKVPEWIAKNSDTLYYPISCWDSLYKKLGNHRPSTGAMIINLFCEHLTVTQLSIVGFDFKKSKTYYLGNDHKGPHHWENEEIYATNLVSEAVNNQLNWSIK